MTDHLLVIDGSQKSVKDIVSRLAFISKIDKDHKVDVSKMTLKENNMAARLNRHFFSNESREKTLNFIETTTGEALEIVARCINKDPFHDNIVDVVMKALEESKKGMRELCANESYRDDHMFVANIETYISLLDVKMEYLKASRATKQHNLELRPRKENGSHHLPSAALALSAAQSL
jgi:hypothetical protein